MGVNGEDIQLSPAARKLICYKFECKNTEGFAKIYNAYEQCQNHRGNNIPVVCIKSNNKPVLFVIDDKTFFNLIQGIH